jgi:hypothetical protein
MAKINKNSFRLDADFTEETVGFAIESFLALLSFPYHRFSIEPFSGAKERTLGADARLVGRVAGFRPFYMQFKRPFAYPDHSTSKIIKDRRKIKLGTLPLSLYFPLREKQPSHSDYQQNVLFKLRDRLLKRKLGDAAYVCPLFLDRSAYRFHVHLAGLSRWLRRWRFDPFELEDVLIRAGGNTIRFDRLPILNEHVTVPPHEKVSSAKHTYSFNERGAEVCFHSPRHLPDGSASLGTFLKQISQGFLNDGEKVTDQTGITELNSLLDAVPADTLPIELRDTGDGRNFLERWFAWGDFLQEQYDIQQYAFVRWDDMGPL